MKFVILVLASALFFSSCAKKSSSPSRVGGGSGQQNRTDTADTSEKGAGGSATPVLGSGSQQTSDDKSADQPDPNAAAGGSSTSTTTTTTLPHSTNTSPAADSGKAESTTKNDSDLDRIESASGDTDISVEVGESDENSDGSTSEVQTNNSTLGYKQNLLKLAKGTNRVSQVISLGLIEKDYVETISYCWNGKNDQLPTEKVKTTLFYLLPSSRVLVEERNSDTGGSDYVLNSCESLAKPSDKNYFEQIQTYLDKDPEELKKQLTATQIASLKAFDFVSLDVGSASREEYVSSDGSDQEAIKTSISCVETLKAKKLMKPDLDADKKVKNRITLASGSTIYFKRPLDAKDEKGRVLKTLPELTGKSFIVISCGK